MSLLAVVLLLVMLARQGGGGGFDDLPPVKRPPELPYSPVPVPSAPKALPQAAATVVPPPWPQTVPAGLPPFGPAGWQPDDPPPLAVQTRAVQLLPQLWKYGPGTRKTEKTAARWITYQAEPMGRKKGVVAYRVRDDIVQNQPPATVDPSSTPMV